MKCRSCGTSFENRSHYCLNCGKKQKAFNLIPLLVLVALLCTSAFGFVLFHYYNPSEFSKTPKTTAVVDSSVKEEVENKKEQVNNEVTKTEAKPANEIAKNVLKPATIMTN